MSNYVKAQIQSPDAGKRYYLVFEDKDCGLMVGRLNDSVKILQDFDGILAFPPMNADAFEWMKAKVPVLCFSGMVQNYIPNSYVLVEEARYNELPPEDRCEFTLRFL